MCAGPRQPPNFWRRCHLLVSPESYWFDNLGIFTEGNLLLHYISNLPLGVTNEGGEAIMLRLYNYLLITVNALDQRLMRRASETSCGRVPSIGDRRNGFVHAGPSSA